ncbi:MAG: class II glutamine amidotransferase, partial [Gammaproteobacteria bacterium]
MCGIVGAISGNQVASILLDGLKRLEYRGYDSAGIAINSDSGELQRIRSVGKVSQLQELLERSPIQGVMGIAHTRWATHGMPAERNAHPHQSGERVAVVHNGIIENHVQLRKQLEDKGYIFTSDTDTEVIAHLLASMLDQGTDLLTAVRDTTKQLVGAYALAVMSPDDSERLVVARAGSPLVVGVSDDGNYVASDVYALLPVTRRFLFLDEGDIAEIRRSGVSVYDADHNPVERPTQESNRTASEADKGQYRHYMLKEIFEQP